MALSRVVIAPFARAWVSAERRRPAVVPSPTCEGLVAAHDGVNPQPVLLGPRLRRVTACRGCLHVIEELVDVQPERRR